MNTVTEIKDWLMVREGLAGKTVGFVPTMGHLHAGHLSLCRRSQLENEITVVSIFVNPTQFDQEDDFNHYPRTLLEDQTLLESSGIDYLLLPKPSAMYPDQYQVRVTEQETSQELEGKFRPGHFNGMLTIVMKLLNLVQPKRAYFGEKDYQQLILIKKMVSALFIPTEIVSCETVRAEDGLALSSRNSRLNSQQRQKAIAFPTLLQSGLTSDQITEKLHELGFKVDYICDKWQRRLGAVWLDNIRLIDNIPIQNEG